MNLITYLASRQQHLSLHYVCVSGNLLNLVPAFSPADKDLLDLKQRLRCSEKIFRRRRVEMIASPDAAVVLELLEMISCCAAHQHRRARLWFGGGRCFC